MFADRLENDLSVFRPNIATVCYGMNDGNYRPYSDDVGKKYEDGLRKVISRLSNMGVSKVIVCSPGAVDTGYFKLNNLDPKIYNDSLRRLKDIAQNLADEFKVDFADMHTPVVTAMEKAKAVMGDDYDVCGRDGMHPDANGHLVMTYALLKALGCLGDIGEVTIYMNGGATAGPGHKVLSFSGAEAEFESQRLPFCFDSDNKTSSSNRSILPFIPFNQELNRLILKVVNLDAPKAEVKWGEGKMEFTKEQLESGINLAAEFSRTPFDTVFSKFSQAVYDKQNFETTMIIYSISRFRWIYEKYSGDSEIENACRTITRRLLESRSELVGKEKAELMPVRHRIDVRPIT